MMISAQALHSKMLEISNTILTNKEASNKIDPVYGQREGYSVSVSRLYEPYINEAFHSQHTGRMFKCFKNEVVALWILHRSLGTQYAIDQINHLFDLAQQSGVFNTQHRHHLFKEKSYLVDLDKLKYELSKVMRKEIPSFNLQ